MSRSVELMFFGEQPEAIGRKFFEDVRGAREWAEKILRMNLEIYCCVIYEAGSLFEQLYMNGREIIRLLEPWALSRRQAKGLYIEGGRVRGLPQRYMIYE
jgi:hypothetical protein